MKHLKLVIVGLIVVLGSYVSWLYLFGSIKAAERKAYWEETVAQEIPTGSTKAQIQQWVKKHSFVLDELPQEQKLFVVVEKLPKQGPVCAQWDIIMQIGMDGLRSSQQKVESVGSCF